MIGSFRTKNIHTNVGTSTPKIVPAVTLVSMCGLGGTLWDSGPRP